MKYLTNNSGEVQQLLERFLKYVKIYSTSDSSNADKGLIPSTAQQSVFAGILADELKFMKLSGIQITEHFYVYGFLPASSGCEHAEPLCMMAHMDTIEEVCGKDVKPDVIKNYNGQKISLKDGFYLDPVKEPALAQAGQEHDTVITSDGTTLLGADDKAGIAAIMTAVHYLQNHAELKHGKIEVLFSPDEETGHGMDKVPLELISSKRCYTVDGGHVGELETECFNAFKTNITFTGKSTHTGTARAGGMINAVTMAGTFIANLPRHEAPETTDGYQGFYAPMTISGSVETSTVTLLLRDFTARGMKKRQELVRQIAETVANSFGGTVLVVHTQQYLNMKQKMDEHPEVVQDLVSAYNKAGLEPVCTPIRGGTDGSRLTEMGIPTPNIFTGGHNYHSHTEWASLSQMTAAAEVIIQLAVILEMKKNDQTAGK